MSVISVPGVFTLNGVPMIDPAKLKEIVGYNTRAPFNPATCEEDRVLLASITKHGFLTDKPVTVRFVGKDVYVIAGHRRRAATLAAIANGAKIRGIAILPEGKGASGGTRDNLESDTDLVTSNEYKTLDPVERGAIFLRMRSYGQTDAQIADIASCSEKWVRELCKAARAEPRIRALVKAGVVAPTLALETVAKHGAKAADVIEAAAKKGTGANAGKATGKTIAAVTGTPAKNAKTAPVVPTAPVDRLAQNNAQHAELAAKMANKAPASGKPGTSALRGPFHLGTGMDDCTLYDVANVLVCEYSDLTAAQFMLKLTNQGWHTFAGKPLVSDAQPVKVVPTVKIDAKAPDTAELITRAMAGTATVETVIAGAAKGKPGQVARKR